MRFGVDLAGYPRLARVASHLNSLDPFRRAAPERQIDTE
jgi:hypothetical protein